MTRRVLCGAVAVLLVALTALALTPAGREQLALSFTRVPEPFVELYFPNDPPASTDRGEVVAEFVVAAHDGSAGRYSYVAQLRDGAGGITANRAGDLDVPADGATTTAVRLAVPSGTTWDRLQIGLLGRSESLSYHNPAVRPP